MAKKAKTSKRKTTKKNDLPKSKRKKAAKLAEDDDDLPEILEPIEPDEAIGTIIKNIHPSTIVTLLLGILVGIFLYIAKYVNKNSDPDVFSGLVLVIIGFAAGLLIVFGASEIIILGVQGIKDKLNWNPYIAGILSAIGAALAEFVVVTFLLIRSHLEPDPEVGGDLATTAIILILTTVIINILFLGIAMIFVSRKGPFGLPKELTMYEANLVLGMRVFTFVLLLYGLFYEFTDIKEGVTIPSEFGRGVEIVIGIALLLVYGSFLFILVKRYGKKTSTPQTLMIEFIDEEDKDTLEAEDSSDFIQLRMSSTKDKETKGRAITEEPFETVDEGKSHRDHDALATLRRYPWFVIIILFAIGAGGIIWGGELLASGIESGLHVLEHDFSLEVPILVYAVIVGLISTSPELIVTFRGLLSPDEETQKIGLINQVSAINQTFFILFGFPLLLSGIIGIGIPITLSVTMVMGCIYIMSTAEKMMIMDDNKFDLLEGVVITILAIVSLLALAFMGGV